MSLILSESARILLISVDLRHLCSSRGVSTVGQCANAGRAGKDSRLCVPPRLGYELIEGGQYVRKHASIKARKAAIGYNKAADSDASHGVSSSVKMSELQP